MFKVIHTNMIRRHEPSAGGCSPFLSAEVAYCLQLEKTDTCSTMHCNRHTVLNKHTFVSYYMLLLLYAFGQYRWHRVGDDKEKIYIDINDMFYL